MKRIDNKPELGIVRKLKTVVPTILRSVGDDAASYKGNQQRYVIEILNHATTRVKPQAL